MLLLKIPVQVWQYILYDWVGLSEIVRFDLATSVKSAIPLSMLYSEHLFCLSDNRPISSKQLDNLLRWMQSRYVYLREISTCISLNSTPQWGHILEWTGSQVRVLELCYFNSLDNNVFEVLSLVCFKLESLTIRRCSTSAKIFRTILSNNVTTLKTIRLVHFRLTGTCDLNAGLPELKLRDLSIAQCKGTIIRTVLLKSAHFSSLGLSGINFKNKLTEWLAPCGQTLRELHIQDGTRMDDSALLKIAQICPNIEFLSITNCDESYFESIGEVVGALPKLQKLGLDIGSDMGPLEEIGAWGSQSLWAVLFTGLSFDMENVVTERSFQQFSQGCPNLTVLLLHKFCAQCTIAALQFCPNLRYLEVGEIGFTKASEVLESAARYCPLLRTLHLSCCLPDYYPQEVIDEVLGSCTQITKLILTDYYLYSGDEYIVTDFEITDPAVRARVTVVREGSLCLGTCRPP